MAGRVDDEQAEIFSWSTLFFRTFVLLLLNRRDRDVGGADQLGDATCLALLDVITPQLVQDLGLARIPFGQGRG